jgi:large subunit ribosomal protein L32e
MSNKKPKFLRADTVRLLRLGKNRRKIQKWRRPRGHHNKLRLKRFSYPVQPGIGYGSLRKDEGKIGGLYPVLVHNLTEMQKLNSKTQCAILARIGAKKKIDMLKKAQESGLKVINIDGGSRR